MPNNRQIAIVIVLGVGVLLLLLFVKDLRTSLRQLLRLALTPKLAAPFVGFAIWIGAAVLAAAWAGLWRPAVAADTVMWFCTSGLLLVARFENAWREPQFVRRTTLAALEVGLVLGVLVELHVMSLPVEILWQIVVIFLSLLGASAALDVKNWIVEATATQLLQVLGAGVFLYSIYYFAIGWRNEDFANIARAVALPAWLTAAAVPYVYGVALLAAYETTFLRIGFKSEASRRVRLGQYLAVLVAFRFSARGAVSFAGGWPHRLADTRSFAESRKLVRDFSKAESQRKADERAAENQLLKFAGVIGRDDEGRQLDRREFDETMAALRWLATCQMGWFHNHGGRYREDVLTILDDDFTHYGLPRKSGITMSVSSDGSCWYAWRRTITGWTFAIGAKAAPPDQWLLDGPEPPSGPPGVDERWSIVAWEPGQTANW